MSSTNLADTSTKAGPARLHVTAMSVRWRDLDAFNHVNNSSYLTYLEEARLQWLTDVPGASDHDQAQPVLVASHLNYRRSISWPARLQIELFCERLGNTSLTISHRIIDADQPDQLYCDGNVTMVWLDPALGTPVILPDPIRRAAQG
jgi:acyl-CoA thioester hydrolase